MRSVVYGNGEFVAVGNAAGSFVQTSGKIEQPALAANNFYQGAADVLGGFVIGSTTLPTTMSGTAQFDVYGATTSAQDIFAISTTTGARLLTFTAGGRLGIGTTTPSSALSVVGTTTSQGLSLTNLALAGGSFLAVDPFGNVIATTTPTGGTGISSAYASSSFPTFAYASSTFALAASSTAYISALSPFLTGYMPYISGSTSTIYTTLNPSNKGLDLVLSNSNLTVSDPISNFETVSSVIGKSSGKWYWEVTPSGAPENIIGVGDITLSTSTFVGSSATSWGYYGSSGQVLNSGSGSACGATYGAGDIIGVALDMNAGTVDFYKNGVHQCQETGLTGTMYSDLTRTTMLKRSIMEQQHSQRQFQPAIIPDFIVAAQVH